MYLLYCASCKDAFNLSAEMKTCTCGTSSGKYLEDESKVYSSKSPQSILFGVNIFLDHSETPKHDVYFSQYTTSIDVSELTLNTKECAIHILKYLNEKAGTKFSLKYPSSHTKLIEDRIKEHKCSMQDVLDLIDRKVAKWKNTDYEIYLRPVTLFNKTKFANYLGEKQNGTAKSNSKGFSNLIDAANEAKRRLQSSSDFDSQKDAGS